MVDHAQQLCTFTVESYTFAVEAGPGNTLENLVYETSVLSPHRITAPEPAATGRPHRL